LLPSNATRGSFSPFTQTATVADGLSRPYGFRSLGLSATI